MLLQKDVVETIVDEGGDDVLLLEDNHPTIRNATECWFVDEPVRYEDANRTAQHTEKGTGALSPVGLRLQPSSMIIWIGKV